VTIQPRKVRTFVSVDYLHCMLFFSCSWLDIVKHYTPGFAYFFVAYHSHIPCFGRSYFLVINVHVILTNSLVYDSRTL